MCGIGKAYWQRKNPPSGESGSLGLALAALAGIATALAATRASLTATRLALTATLTALTAATLAAALTAATLAAALTAATLAAALAALIAALLHLRIVSHGRFSFPLVGDVQPSAAASGS